jgi:acyl dehydratase
MEGVEIDLPTKVGINYGSDKVRFITPVCEGSRIRLRTFLLAIDSVSEGVWQARYKHVIEIEGEKRPAVVAEVLNRIYA